MNAQINLNDYIWVQLTPEGKTRLLDFCEEQANIMQSQNIAITARELMTRYGTTVAYPSGEWIRFQLNQFIRCFGCMLELSEPAPTVDNSIQLTDPYIY